MNRKWMVSAASQGLLVISLFLTACNGGYYLGTASAVSNLPPSGLTATAGNAQVILSWTAPVSTTAPASYNIYYSTSAGVTTGNGTKVAGITGLTYTQSGLTNGTTYYFVVTAVYSTGESAAIGPASATPSAPITVTPLVVSTSSLPGGIESAPYSTTLTATGGTAPYTWSITSGSLPAGLTLTASTGVISGTPTGAGTSSFTVQVKDSESTPAMATANLSITVNPASLIVSSTTLPAGTVNASYSTTLAATGGTAPYTWSITSGSLPAGLTLAASTGVISGTPTGAGTSNFTVQVKDSESTPATATANLSITVNPASLIVSSTTLPAGTVNASYSTTLAATGGTAPYTWSIPSGSLPAGLTLAASTGVISGTPTGAGTSNFTVQVKDSESTPATATANLSIIVNPASLIVSSTTLPAGTVNASYSTTLAATGGTSPYTWSITSGSLPAGLTLAASTGVISGTPTGAGTSNFTVQVKDSESTPATATANLSITVSSGLVIETTELPGGTFGIAYSTTLAATGGTAPYTWSITSGSLPAGLTLAASTGVISGMPTQFQNAVFTLQVQDSESTPQTASLVLSISVYSGLEISSENPADGYISQPYSASLTAAGGASPYTWSVVSGSLPPGITLSSSGSLSGTSSAAGTYLFQAQVSDSESTPSTLTANFSITILAVNQPSIKAVSNYGTVGSPYADVLQTNDNGGYGTAPFTWQIVSGSLPPGVTLPTTGSMAGTPTTAGTYNFVVQVTDANNLTAIAPVTIAIYPAALAINATTIQAGNVGEHYSVSNPFKITGGTGSYTVAIISGSLPNGVSLSSDTLAGTPTEAGAFTFTVQVTDTASNTVSQMFTFNVYQDPACPSGSESELNGTYAFQVQGFAGYGLGFPEAMAVSFTANGSGGITAAEGDMNISTASGSQALTFTNASSYSVGADGMGCLTLVNSTGTSQTFAFSLGGLTSGVATRGTIINFDNGGRTGAGDAEYASPGRIVAILSGTLAKQTTADFALNRLSSNFAFGLAGTDDSLGHFGFIGSLANSSSGVFSSVAADSNDHGTVESQMTGGNGGFTGTPDASGRVPAGITVGGKTYHYIAYIVDANTAFLISSDAIGVNPIAAGTMLATDSSFSDASLSGNYIYSGVGSDPTNGSGGFFTTGLINFSGSTFSATSYPYEYQCHCGTWSGVATAATGSYTVDPASGRAALTASGSSNEPVFYLAGSGSGIAGFLLDTESGASAPAYEGQILAQPAITYSTDSVSGSYLAAVGQIASNPFNAAIAGVLTLNNGIGTLVADGTETTESLGANVEDGPYSVTANGTGQFGISDSGVILITNGTTFLNLDPLASGGALTIFEQQ